MPTSANNHDSNNKSRQEHPSTYVVQDRTNREELTRLRIQDQMMTIGMGGVLPEQSQPLTLSRVLDVGCGTGGWLIELARTDPDIARLTGVDISGSMLDYAREQAAVQQSEKRVEFHVMDALRMLEFPSNYFDLVNMRFGLSWLRTWDWGKLLQEFQRVVRPDGIVRITESDMIANRCSSPALTRINQIFADALTQAGHLFPPDSEGVLGHLAPLLEQHGMQNVQTRAYALEYRPDTPAGQLFCENMKRGLQTGLPFMRKWARVPDDYQDICQQAMAEMQQPDFVAYWNVLTAWGTA